MIATGLDRLLEEPHLLAGRRYGLLAHGAAVTHRLEPAHLALARVEPPSALFGPEHGFYAVEQDMVPSADAVDPWTGVPVLSLYGEHEASLRPQPEAFAGLDLLLIDLQDVGARYYTFCATAVWAAEAALAAGCEVWVLDRPNPLGGEAVEGPLVRAGYTSFVGAFALPVRHGLTLGEIVQLEAARGGWDGEVEVWMMDGWRRSMTWEQVDRRWIAPSPNMPSLDTVFLYPGACLVESTELSEGRGTTRPFQLLGGSGVDGRSLADRLAKSGLEGVSFVPTFFRPQFQKCAGEVCGGVEVVVTDRSRFRPFRCGVECLRALGALLGSEFTWRREPYEFVSDRPAIDLLTGDDRCRRGLEGEVDLDAWIASWRADEEAFLRRRRSSLLYR